MKLKPLGERVVLRTIKAGEERTASGIYLPKSSEEKKQGEVVDVGTLKDGRTIPLNKGDKVIYGGYSSEEFELNGEKHLIVEFKDILAKIEEDAQKSVSPGKNLSQINNVQESEIEKSTQLNSKDIYGKTNNF